MWTDVIGWSAAAVLLLTVGRQVFTEWRERSTQGLSKWLFVGQLVASTGFVAYSWLLGNWVFVTTNVLMLATAGTGQWIYLRNKRHHRHAARQIDDSKKNRQLCVASNIPAAQPARKSSFHLLRNDHGDRQLPRYPAR